MLLEGDDPSPDDIWVSSLAEWVQILVRAIDLLRSETPDGPSIPSIVRIYDKQFKQWREKAELNHTCWIRLYDNYARLVVHSHAFQRADNPGVDRRARAH